MVLCQGVVVALLGLSFLRFWSLGGGAPPFLAGPSNGLAVGAPLLAGLVLFWFRSRPRATRRLGLSVKGITLDFGLARRTVPWDRVRISGPRRLEARFPRGRQVLRLTASQENRIFPFLGIRPSP
jgi:hypothetical protein